MFRRRVEDAFGFAEMRIVSFADLYGGKIVAALDRQHPRDLFDVRDLLANEGVDDALRRAFLVYLLSHGRPMAEVLTARPKDITGEFERGFAGMTAEPVSLSELLVTRKGWSPRSSMGCRRSTDNSWSRSSAVTRSGLSSVSRAQPIFLQSAGGNATSTR